MSDWVIHTLGDIVEVNRKITYGIVQPGPDISPDGIPLIRGKDYSSGKVSTEGLYHVSTEIDAPFQRSKVKGGDLLLSIAGYVGKAAIVPEELSGANLTQTTARLSIDEVKASNKFVFYVLNSEEFELEVKKYEKGSAQSGLNLGDVEKFKVRLPGSLPQQQKIAHILTTVDNLIEKTHALIDKYTAVKQGMMHDLFTRGIDLATGQLRPSYEQAPELYKETELGWVPREWDCCSLGDHIEKIDSGWSPVCESERAPVGQWGVLKTTAVVWSGYDDGENKLLPSVMKGNPRVEVKNGDLLITRKGPMDRVGVVVIVEVTRDKLMFPDTVFRTRINSEAILLSAYAPLCLSSYAVQAQWEARKIGLAEAQVNINHGIVRKTKILIPCADEQKNIASIISTISEKIRKEEAYLKKLDRQKKGLMQDLLTGRVRVGA